MVYFGGGDFPLKWKDTNLSFVHTLHVVQLNCPKQYQICNCNCNCNCNQVVQGVDNHNNKTQPTFVLAVTKQGLTSLMHSRICFLYLNIFLTNTFFGSQILLVRYYLGTYSFKVEIVLCFKNISGKHFFKLTIFSIKHFLSANKFVGLHRKFFE